jgi:hypothetical protein
MQILSSKELDGETSSYKEIVHWTSNGKAFKIKNRHKLSLQVLPLYFGGEAEFRSFTRRLLRWGFRRITKKGDDDNGVFFHEVSYQETKIVLFAAEPSCAVVSHEIVTVVGSRDNNVTFFSDDFLFVFFFNYDYNCSYFNATVLRCAIRSRRAKSSRWPSKESKPNGKKSSAKNCKKLLLAW